MTKNLLQLIKQTAKDFDIEWQMGAAFVKVESPGRGFDEVTGKILIQFEPAWFRRNAPYAPSGAWSVNGVERQKAEWVAFNNAFSIDKESAMLSTSIGVGQIMGFHYERLGYKTVGEMWDDAKKGEHRQIWQIFQFIATDISLLTAVRSRYFSTIASLYNGAGYKKQAIRLGITPYDEQLKTAYYLYKQQ
jgi:hypothetical protein